MRCTLGDRAVVPVHGRASQRAPGERCNARDGSVRRDVAVTVRNVARRSPTWVQEGARRQSAAKRFRRGPRSVPKGGEPWSADLTSILKHEPICEASRRDDPAGDRCGGLHDRLRRGRSVSGVVGLSRMQSPPRLTSGEVSYRVRLM